MLKYLVIFFINLTLAWSISISGYVKDSSTGKSIPNANIAILETSQGTASNPYGYFKLDIAEGIYTIEISVIGFKTDTREIKINENDLELSIDLQTAILEFNEIQVQGLFNSRLGNESVDVINSETITSMDKVSVPDFLSVIPGIDVQFAQPNGRNVNVSIRGSSDYKPGGYNNRVLILLDGFPILIPNSGSPDWNSLPLESIQRIEVDNNPASAQYGHNSMGGVINLITDHKGMDKSTILRLSGGANTTGQTSLTHRNKKGKWAYGVNAMVRSSEGHRFNSDDKTTRLRSYMRYEDQKGRTYRLSHIISYSDIGHPGFIRIPSYRKSERLSQYLQGHGFYAIKNGLSMSHSVFLNKFYTHYYDRGDTPEDEKEGGRDYDDLSLGFRSEMLITKWARWNVMTGTDVEWTRSEVDVLNPQYEVPSQLSIGGFVQSKYSIGNGWSLGTGFRYDYRRTDPGGNFQKRIYTNFSPKLNLMYKMQNERAFTLTYSEGFRAPSLSELYLLHEASYGLFMQGNPSLSPENVRASEAMYEHPHSDSWYWSISVFHNRYENMIDFVYNIPVEARNRKKVTGTGGEFELRWKPVDSFNVTGSYAYLDMLDQNGDPILYRSTHRTGLHFNYYTKIIKIRLGAKGWSKQIYEFFLADQCEQNKNDNCWIQEDNKIIFPIRELPEKIIYELILSREIDTYTGSFRVSNLFDTRYELIQDFPMPGRTWQFTLTKTIAEI